MARTKHKRIRFICQSFFPLWDRKNEWTITTNTKRCCYGYCDEEQKTIYVNYISDLTILHEIVHAICGGGHGKAWQERMAKAAKRAENLGLHALVCEIQEEISAYSEGFTPTAKYIYDRVESVVIDTNSKVGFNAVIESIGNEFGLTPSEMLRKYKRLKCVYDSTLYDQKAKR